MSKKVKFSESDLAEKIIHFLENLGWVSYKEVSIKGKGGGIRSDSYFVKREGDQVIESLSLETKLNLSLKVIEQADKWKNHANRCYICIPAPKRNQRKSFQFGIKVCKQLNIGLFEVNMYDGSVRELNSPTPFKSPNLPPLYEQQRSSVAGNNKGSFITAFKVTVMNLDEYMQDKDNIEIKEVVSNIKHHYKTEKSAISTIQKYINEEIIKGYSIKRDDKKILICKK
jgi:hypothetical protein